MPDNYGRSLFSCTCGDNARLGKAEIDDFAKRHKELKPDQEHKLTKIED